MEEEKIRIDKNEKKGIWTLLVLFFVSWGLLIFNNSLFRLIAWVSLGLIGFTFWRVIDGLFERITIDKERLKGGK